MVNIKAEPKPEVRWFLDDNEVTSGGAVTIEGDGTYSRLTVTKTSSKDSGKYKVTAENTIGSDSAEFAVAVTGKVLFWVYASVFAGMCMPIACTNIHVYICISCSFANVYIILHIRMFMTVRVWSLFILGLNKETKGTIKT